MLVEGHDHHQVAQLGHPRELNLLLFGLNADNQLQPGGMQPRSQLLEKRVKQRLAVRRQFLETNRQPRKRVGLHIVHQLVDGRSPQGLLGQNAGQIDGIKLVLVPVVDQRHDP